MIALDEVAYHNNLSNANPYLKCGFGTIALIAALCASKLEIFFPLLLVIHLLILGIAKISFKFYLKLLSIPLTFLGLSMVSILLTISHEPIGFIHSVHIGSYFMGYSKETIETTIFLLLRCLTCISSMYFMTLTTPMHQQIMVLKKLHCPSEIIELMLLMYRFIFIFLEEVEAIKLSLELRFGYVSLKHSYVSTGILIKQLFQRINKRYQALSLVLELKLYQGKFY